MNRKKALAFLIAASVMMSNIPAFNVFAEGSESLIVEQLAGSSDLETEEFEKTGEQEDVIEIADKINALENYYTIEEVEKLIEEVSYLEDGEEKENLNNILNRKLLYIDVLMQNVEYYVLKVEESQFRNDDYYKALEEISALKDGNFKTLMMQKLEAIDLMEMKKMTLNLKNSVVSLNNPVIEIESLLNEDGEDILQEYVEEFFSHGELVTYIEMFPDTPRFAKASATLEKNGTILLERHTFEEGSSPLTPEEIGKYNIRFTMGEYRSDNVLIEITDEIDEEEEKEKKVNINLKSNAIEFEKPYLQIENVLDEDENDVWPSILEDFRNRKIQIQISHGRVWDGSYKPNTLGFRFTSDGTIYLYKQGTEFEDKILTEEEIGSYTFSLEISTNNLEKNSVIYKSESVKFSLDRGENNPTDPDDTEEPVTPEEPSDSEDNETPDNPGDNNGDENPENPDDTEEPVTPQDPSDSNDDSENNSGDKDDESKDEEIKEPSKPEVPSTPPPSGGGSSGGGSSSGGGGSSIPLNQTMNRAERVNTVQRIEKLVENIELPQEAQEKVKELQTKLESASNRVEFVKIFAEIQNVIVTNSESNTKGSEFASSFYTKLMNLLK